LKEQQGKETYRIRAIDYEAQKEFEKQNQFLKQKKHFNQSN
jgi:hypothetical protein